MSDETGGEIGGQLGGSIEREPSADHVRQDMFAVLHGQETPLLTRWSYRADDPFAVMMSISRPSGRWIDWLLSRDLLVEGLAGPAGIGDVRLTPFCDEGRDGEFGADEFGAGEFGGEYGDDVFDVLEVRIGDDEGFASLEFDRNLIERFLAATFEVVPPGQESAMIDVEAEIEKITNSRAC